MSADSMELTGGDVTVFCEECDSIIDIEHTQFSKPVSKYIEEGDTEHKSTCKTRCICGHEISVELEVWSCNGYSIRSSLTCDDDECFNHLEFEIKRNYY